MFLFTLKIVIHRSEKTNDSITLLRDYNMRYLYLYLYMQHDKYKNLWAMLGDIGNLSMLNTWVN